jgi:integrase
MNTAHFSLLTASGRIAVHLRRRGALWHADFHRAGLRRRLALKTPDAREARRLAETRILADLQPDSAPWTLAAAVARYLAECWPDPSSSAHPTARDHRYRLALFAGAAPAGLSLTNPAAVRLSVAEFLRTRAAKVAAQTVVNDQRVLSRFCRWVMQSGLGLDWPYNPAAAERQKIPRILRRPGPAADPADVAALLEDLRARRHELWPVVVLALSGARRCGACRARWSDLKADRKLHLVEKGRPHVPPLGEWAWRQLSAARGQPLPVADASTIWPYSPNALTHALKRESARALGHSVSWSQLRRAVESRLDEAAAEVRAAAEVMGHSVAVADRHYRQGGTPQAAAAADRLDWSAPAARKERNA